MIAKVVYVLCGLTSTLCAVALYRQFKRTGMRLLLWSALCFAGLALNNYLLFVDMVLVSWMDLSVVRTLPALGGVMILLYGFIWESP